MADEWVAMRHPDVPAEHAAVVTRAAFDEVWADKGWQAVKGSEATSADAVDVTAGQPAKVAKAKAESTKEDK